MKLKKYIGSALAGTGAGAVNGLFGAGGGMILIPLLTKLTQLEDNEIFPSSVIVILPICLVSLTLSFEKGIIPWKQTVFYLIGSCAGGILVGLFGKKIPTSWLHKILGMLILWGGIRYLC